MHDDDANTDPPLVGHKQPPKEHQFKKGQSGNPGGRPKGAMVIRRALQRAMLEPGGTYNFSNHAKGLTQIELLMQRRFDHANSGNDRAAQQLIEMIETYFGGDIAPPEQS